MAPRPSDVDAIMARSVVQRSDAVMEIMARAAGLEANFRAPQQQRWYAYLPGTLLPTVWRDDHAAALGALRELLVKRWLPTLRELRQSARRAA